jgi:hypothetical protein
MSDGPVQSPGPVGALGGFAGRTPADTQRRSPSREETPARAVDRVSIHGTAAIASRLLRERVLAGTRRLLELDEGAGGPEFAEVIEGEPIAMFLGRLLSAQNQLAARRLVEWDERRVRRLLDLALHAGAIETLDLLAADGRDDEAGVLIVTEVLSEYGRRLAAMAQS